MVAVPIPIFADIRLYPEEKVATALGKSLTFLCLSNEWAANDARWFVNGSRLDGNTTNTSISPLGFLTIDITQEYNMTYIHCVVTLASGDPMPSPRTLILLQGAFIM